VGEFVPIPRYWDSQIRAAWVPHEGESIEVGALLSSDHISRSLVEADPKDNKTETKSTGFERVYVRYSNHDGGRGHRQPHAVHRFDHYSLTNVFGATEATLNNEGDRLWSACRVDGSAGGFSSRLAPASMPRSCRAT